MDVKNRSLLLIIAACVLTLPATGINTYYLSVLTTSLIFVLFTLSWDIIGGVCGQLTLGQALFFGSGTYSFAVLCTVYGIHPAAAVLATLTISLLLALSTGIFAMKLRGAFFALFTLCLCEIAHELSLNTPFGTSQQFFIGGEGGIPLFGGQGALDRAFLLKEYYLCFLFVILLVTLMVRLLSGTKGLALRAIAGNEMLAKACGVKTERLKLMAYCASAMIASAGGILYVIQTGRATPGDFSVELSFQVATLAAVGGRGNITGPAVSALAITAVFSLLNIPPVIRMTMFALVLPVMLLSPSLKLLQRGSRRPEHGGGK